MAAPLQSFNSNEKQMQAIRELTNEMFNLKNRASVSESAIATLESDVSDIHDYLIISDSVGLDPSVTLDAGELGSVIDIPVTAPSGYTFHAFYTCGVTNGDGIAEGIINVLCLLIGSTMRIKLLNPTATQLTAARVYYTLIFKKS